MANQARRSGRRLQIGVALAGAGLIIGVWVTVFAILWRDRESAITETETDSTNLTLAFEEQIVRTIGAIDQTMRFLQADIEREGSSFDLQRWLAHAPSMADLSLQLAIIGPDGRLKASSLDANPDPIDLGDREHFRAHVADDSGRLFIGKPVVGRVSNKWSIQLSRRLNGPDGSFAGVLVFSLDPSYLTRLYQDVNVGESGFILLAGLDGVVRAYAGKHASDGIGLNTSIADSGLMRQVNSAPIGTSAGPSAVDGIQRIVGYRLVRGYPLVVMVGYGLSDALATADAAGARILVMTVVATLIFAALTVYLAIEIGRRTRREEELARERSKLETNNRDLQELNQQLIESRNRAESASRTKSVFLAAMSHELRTPLNSIIGFSEIIRDQMFGSIGVASYAQYADHIHESGTHLLSVISNILDVAKAEAGQLDLHEEVVDIAKAVSASVRTIHAQALKVQLSVSIELPTGLPSLSADSVKIRQILINLLSNAVKFTPKGGKIAVGAWLEPSGKLALAVSDTGIGMAPDEIPIALAPFRQIDSRLSRRFEGTGLGLPLTKRLVELHGGTLEIASVPARGTTVTVRFPQERVLGRRRPEPAAALAEEAPGEFPRRQADPAMEPAVPRRPNR